MLNGLLQWMNNLVQNIGSKLLTLLPTSPFRSFISSWNAPQYLGWLNWFFPVSEILTILAAWLTAIGLFYLYSIAMRWVKMIGD